MRIMLDTNILISVIMFPSARIWRMMETIDKKHTLVLSSYVLEESVQVAERKFPSKLDDLKRFLTGFRFELVYTPADMEEGLFSIRDKKDYPVLYTAIREEVDILITGDKDFADVDVEKPEIMTPAEFLDRYCQN